MKKPAIEKKFISLSYGNIAYIETGSDKKPPVLFVHGIPTSSYLWRDVLRFLQNDFHCYAPDLMGLGDTDVDPENDCFHMDAQAEMLLEFMSAQGHERFTVVCHDQGGAAVQIMAAWQPDRFQCLVITDCVCYDNWPVPKIAQLQALARIPHLSEQISKLGLFELIETSKTPLSAFRRGVYQADRFRDEAIREYLRPLRSGPRARNRFLNFLRAGSPRYTMRVVDGLRRFDKPTQVLWAAEDFYLSPSWGRKLFEEIPGSVCFELIPFCGHFWQEEKPAEFSSLMGEFISRHTGHRSARKGKNKSPKKNSLKQDLSLVEGTKEVNHA